MRGKTKTSCQKFAISDREILDRKIWANPRFERVQSKVKTGSNGRFRDLMENELKKYYKVKHNELFRRISIMDFIGILLNSEIKSLPSTSSSRASENTNDAFSNRGSDPEEDNYLHFKEIENKGSARKTVDMSLPFLLVDVRSNYKYEMGHLILSINHPLNKLSRTVGWESSEMLAYRNHPNWIVIAYADDETESSEAASLLVQRGYDNVFMLSGGLNLITDKLPKVFVTKEEGRNLTPDLMLQVQMNIDSEVLCKFLEPPAARPESTTSRTRSLQRSSASKQKARSLSVPWH